MKIIQQDEVGIYVQHGAIAKARPLFSPFDKMGDIVSVASEYDSTIPCDGKSQFANGNAVIVKRVTGKTFVRVCKANTEELWRIHYI